MKCRFEVCGCVFEYERKPMPKSRFSALCVIACLLAFIALVAIDNDGFATVLGLFLFGGVCAGILATSNSE